MYKLTNRTNILAISALTLVAPVLLTGCSRDTFLKQIFQEIAQKYEFDSVEPTRMEKVEIGGDPNDKMMIPDRYYDISFTAKKDGKIYVLTTRYPAIKEFDESFEYYRNSGYKMIYPSTRGSGQELALTDAALQTIADVEPIQTNIIALTPETKEEVVISATLRAIQSYKLSLEKKDFER